MLLRLYAVSWIHLPGAKGNIQGPEDRFVHACGLDRVFICIICITLRLIVSLAKHKGPPPNSAPISGGSEARHPRKLASSSLY